MNEEKITNLPEIMDIQDLAELVRVSKQSIRNLVSDKKLPAYRLATGKYIFSTKQLIQHIEDNIGNY